MLAVVLVCNVVLGLLCCYGAWQLWRFKRRLGRAADALLACDRAVHRVLDRAPDAIYKKHAGIHRLREQYQGLEPQLQRAQQALALLSLGQTLWQRRTFIVVPRSRSTRRMP
ncbi:hypothetical protein [Stenomitos frigidus]|uniref:Uncharacterized protein n=1 Tax=Stenomitos frigidus ULC18 TaxID=2107698 RepID=A0A2T1DZH6_9CYAN|nr:hypothetical protein [Stenomitos frigidus]PSB25905.1 hypothetical protein C7B82_21425 [Stenomitos frigidus ULC18]